MNKLLCLLTSIAKPREGAALVRSGAMKDLFFTQAVKNRFYRSAQASPSLLLQRKSDSPEETEWHRILPSI